MTQAAETDNMERYKSYIQRRRAVTAPETYEESITLFDKGLSGDDLFENRSSAGIEETDDLNGHVRGNGENAGSENASGIDTDAAIPFAESPFKDFFKEDARESCAGGGADGNAAGGASRPAPFRRTDQNIYRKLYGNKRKSPFSGNSFTGGSNSASSYTGSYARTYHGGGLSGSGTQIEDNRTTVLAIKVIKQSLACFALLGIIVLMQQNSSMAGVLEFIKKHVVESHIEPGSLLTGVQDLVKECARFFGGAS